MTMTKWEKFLSIVAIVCWVVGLSTLATAPWVIIGVVGAEALWVVCTALIEAVIILVAGAYALDDYVSRQRYARKWREQDEMRLKRERGAA